MKIAFVRKKLISAIATSVSMANQFIDSSAIRGLCSLQVGCSDALGESDILHCEHGL